MIPARLAQTSQRPGRIVAPRALAAGTLDTLGILDRLLWLRGFCRLPLLDVFTYHRTAEPTDIGELDGGVADSTARDLRAQIALIKEHCTPIVLDDLRRSLRGRPLPPNPVLITFDDGYRDCHDVALPILREAGVPATFFIPTAYPGAGRLFWWDRVALTLRRCRRERVELSYPIPMSLSPMLSPEVAAARVYVAIKRTPGVDIERTLAELERASGVSIDPAEERRIAGATIMDWPHIRALRAAGMDVQSHGHSHTVLNTMSPADALSDLTRSRRLLGEALGEVIHAVAYPVGYPLRGVHRDAVRAAGYELGFTNNTGVGMTLALDPLNVPRIAMDRGQVGAFYKLKLLAGQRS